MRHTEDESAPEVGHETSDVSIGTIVKFGIGLGVAALLVLGAMWGLFRVLDVRADKRDRPLPPLVAAGLQRTPPEPRLEPNALVPRRRIQAEENATLTSYGWVDRDAGVVRIPIERAMELLVERGLPASKPMAVPTPTGPTRETTPRPGTP